MSFIPDSPPADATAEVEQTPQGTQITLRPRGWERWLLVGFAVVWVIGSLVFDVVWVRLLWGSTQDFPTDTLLLWMVGVGVVGGVLFSTVLSVVISVFALRIGWSRDVITLLPGGWTHWRGVGPFGRRANYASDQPLDVRMRRRSVEAEVDETWVTLTSHGSDADQRWLRDVLRQASGLGPHPLDADSDASRRGPWELPSGPPPGWEQDLLPDRTVRLRPTSEGQLKPAVFVTLFALSWNGLLIVFVLTALRGEFDGWWIWLFLTPFVVIGVGMIGATLWCWWGEEELKVRRDSLVIENSLFGLRWIARYSGGELRIEKDWDIDSGLSWSLNLDDENGEHQLQGGWRSEEAARMMAVIVARETGWPVWEERQGWISGGPTAGQPMDPPGADAVRAVTPHGWEGERLANGGVRLSQTRRSRWTKGCIYSVGAVGWNGGLTYFYLSDVASVFLGAWLMLGCFGIIGLTLAWGALAMFLVREDWLLGPDRLETVHRFLLWRRARRFDPGVVQVQAPARVHNASLVVKSVNKDQLVRAGPVGEIRALAAIVAQETGWPLEETGKDE